MDTIESMNLLQCFVSELVIVGALSRSDVSQLCLYEHGDQTESCLTCITSHLRSRSDLKGWISSQTCQNFGIQPLWTCNTCMSAPLFEQWDELDRPAMTSTTASVRPLSDKSWKIGAKILSP